MDTWILIGGAFLSCAVSGVVPLVNAELVVLTTALLVPRSLLVLLIVACATGQMLAKAGIYACARWAPTRLPSGAASKLDRLSRKIGNRPRTQGVLVFGSACLGLPPLYAVTVACGLLGVNPMVFYGSGLAGRAVRFGLLALGSVSGAGLWALVTGMGA